MVVFAPIGTGWYGMMGWGTGWGLMFMTVPLLLVLLLILVVGALSPSHPIYAPPTDLPSPPSAGIEVLNARYARGEITRDEYLRIREDLNGRTS